MPDVVMSASSRHADPAAVSTALRAAAEHGAFFVLDLPETGSPPGAAVLADLYRAAGEFDLQELIDHYARRLRTSERRVAASLLFQGFAARLWSPVVGVAAAGLVPDLDPQHLHWWRASPLGLRLDRLTGWNAADLARHAELAAHTVVESNLRPLAGAVRRTVRIAEGLLWGNAASALVGAARVVGTPTARALAVALLAREPLLGTTATVTTDDPLTIRRRSCCLYYRAPGGGLCGDCALSAVPPPSAG